MSDILDKLKKNKNEFKLSEDDFEIFFKINTEAFVISSTSGFFTYVNESFSKMLGYNIEDIINQEFYKFIHPDDIDTTIQAQTKLHNGNTLLSFDNRFLNKNGNYIWITWKAIQNKNKYYAIAYLKGNNDELMSRIAHELKTPLSSIIGFTELLLYNDGLNSEIKEYIEIIAKSGTDLEIMINNLLDMSRITTDNIHYEHISINNLILDIINSFIPMCEKKNIKIFFNQKDSHHIINIDYEKIKHVFKNIINNAIKYNKENGIINIKCEVIDNILNISIKDTGIGIKEHNMKDLYIPFNRLGIKSEYEGNGIGLAYSKKIIDIMRGKINCESVYGEYTTFIISFNIVELKEGTTDIFSNEKSILNILNILYIEDNEPNIKLIKKLVEKIVECNFLYSKNGRDGLKTLRENEIDILLLDLGLPDIDGLDIYKIAKSENLIDKDRIVLVISAEARAKKINELYSEGIYEFIPKPVRMKKFYDIFNKALKKVKK